MTIVDSISGLRKDHSTRSKTRQVCGAMGVAIALLMTSFAVAQTPAPVASRVSPVETGLFKDGR